ncbi:MULTISPECIES: hypothetical protein [Pseudofrankia]|uniref:hypothetical protein n=1 Tax=Pseudofrankia TaxID=2994363 RepID=UPI000234D190|nr:MULTISPECIES: hypothetical protein [Pseudofrankia]OHV28772.1 hypothetical protein BCD49_37340 [Pseudofrankia sp. EUN1h]
MTTTRITTTDVAAPEGIAPEVVAAGPAAGARLRVPGTIRAAQALFLVPLGLFQLAASIGFSVTTSLSDAEYLVAGWAMLMAATGVVAGLRLGRGGDKVARLAAGLLAAQTAFGLVKLTVYHESASFVFFAFTAACATLLALPASRRHFLARSGRTTW